MKKEYEIHYKNKNYKITEDDTKQDNIVQVSSQQYSAIRNQKSIPADIVNIDTEEGLVEIKMNEKKYSYKILSPVHTTIQKLGYNKKSGNSDNTVKAPMPGIVLSIDVHVNEPILKGQNLLKLEAMKMENIIKSPKDGMVKRIHTNISDKVEKNQILIEIE
ncbi:MAG: acetyl-CoA carboxylase biotin carboxyl carrier protein subunit [Saprospiraceae bacterium]|nr:acetyl-CoA carboxylase biotin carboxyl carrier protein subunit [Saprospiraceae bacterium]